MPNFDEIEKMKARYAKRISTKKKLDAMVSLGVSEDNDNRLCLALQNTPTKTHRLLDEGYILDKHSIPYKYIAKGTVEKMYNAIPDDYVGKINVGHSSYTNFPFPVGSWTKQDLEIVDMEDGRKALDVRLNLDEDSIFIQELRRTGVEIGLSIEMLVEHTNNKEVLSATKVPTVVDAQMYEFAIVGEAGNATSGGLTLSAKGDNDLSFIDTFKSKYIKDAAAEVNLETAAGEAATDANAEVIEMSVEDFAAITELVDQVKAERETSETLLTVMDEKITEYEAEIASLKTKLGVAETQAAKDEPVKGLLERLSALTVQHVQDAQNEANKDTVTLSASITDKDIFGSISDNAIGRG